MKKLTFILLSMIITFFNIHAQTANESNWTGFVGAGVSHAFLKEEFKFTTIESYDVNGTVEGSSWDFNVNGGVIHKQKPLACKVDFAVGAIKADDIFYEGETASGFDMNIRMAIGFVPLRTDMFTLICYGNMGCNYDSFEKTIGMITCTVTGTTFFIGGELQGIAKLDKKLGLFASCAYEIPVSGTATIEAKYRSISVSESYDMKSGGHIIIPTIGLVFMF